MTSFDEIDASAFEEAKYIYENEFIDLLSKIVICYYRIVANNTLLENNEERIRDYIHINFLNNNIVRNELGLISYSFECEPKSFGTKEGYIDIKVNTLNSFINVDAYYVIECKRIDNVNRSGKSGLNGKYINEGIMRFVTKKYSSYHRVNGMLGFVVEKIDIDNNIKVINYLLLHEFKESNTISTLQRMNTINDFEYHYFSKHYDIDNVELKLIHLMLDLSDKIIRS